MQKRILAFAIVGAATGFASAPVFAQSNVSVYGVIDEAITSQSQSQRSQVTSLIGSGYTFERLGFKGSEDMGNGLKANFTLEMGLNSNNGNMDNNLGQIFQRLSTIGLSGASWGSVNFGRQYSPVFLNVQAPNDLFRIAGVGSIYSLTNTGVARVSNSIKYDSPRWSGFSVAAMYSMGNTGTGTGTTGNVSTGAGGVPMDLGRQAGFAANYANGPLSLGGGYNKLYLVAPDAFGIYDTQKTIAATGSYDFKVVAINLGWQENKIDDNQQDRTVWNAGLTVPVFGADSVKLQYSDRHDKLVNSADSKLTALGYVHPMSKRTTLYATYAKMKNDNSVAQALIFGLPGVNVTNGYSPDGFQLGLSHFF